MDSSTGSNLVAGRTMPQSLEAEAAVLGSMILDPECIGLVVQKIKTDAFYRLEHQLMFNAIVALWEKKGENFDIVLLRDELKKRGELEEVGGPQYIERIANAVPSSANIEHYVQIVKEKQMLRELIAAAGEVMTDAFETSGDVGDKLDKAEQKIFNVTQKKITGVVIAIKSLLTEAFEAIDKRQGHHVTGIATGFAQLDEKTCGLQNGEMIVIAGRPSMGKTSFAMNIAEHIGADNNIPVALFSLEMSKQQLVERILCSRSMIDSQLVRKGMLNDNQYQELVQTASELSEKPIFVDDTPAITPLELRGKARRLRAQHGIRCIIVDYLQLMSLGGRVESRQQEVSEMSRYLKALARELEIPVVVLSQLNRSPEGREGHRPRMSDLRESGSIEQDADVVMLLHREDYYHRGETDYEETNSAEIIIAKQRNGPTDTIELNFNGTNTRFTPRAKVQTPF
ncbi:MAG: replicative DNA helicase [Planctomycetes bacterium RBG_13_44_8b]|nr:MAG: replicative DNA helicase [Planctomycetes bacterium RBG_13_44_8b]